MNKLTFVFGALRSGTTVFKLMLDSHPDLENPGEVDFIFDYLNLNSTTGRWIYDFKGLRSDRIFQSYSLNILKSDDGKIIAQHFVDQLLQRNGRHLVLNIHRNLHKVGAIYPDAKIIHIIRDPRDVAESCVRMGWAGTTYHGIEQWIEAERSWDRFAMLFDKTNTLQVFFEPLIAGPSQELEKVCKFLKVPFCDNMLHYSSHSSYEAPDQSNIEKWRINLQPRDVALVELRTAGLMSGRNYKLSGYRLDPPDLRERVLLAWTNKTYKWQFGCRRYGYILFFMEKVARMLVKPLHPVLVHRMNAIEKQYLK